MWRHEYIGDIDGLRFGDRYHHCDIASEECPPGLLAKSYIALFEFENTYGVAMRCMYISDDHVNVLYTSEGCENVCRITWEGEVE